MMDHFKSTTVRLTASYLAIIMTMSIAFSIVFYRTSVHELGRPLPPRAYHLVDGSDDFNYIVHERTVESSHILLLRLIFLNLMVLFLGAILSYYLARRSLEPIEAAMDTQARFTSDASHELRTPLTAIKTRNEVALRKPKLTAAQAKDVIKSNLDEINKLESLSEGLLKLSNGDKSLNLKPIFAGDVATEAMNQVIPAAQAKKVQIEDDIPKLKVLADSQSLSQVVAILLDNAIKYSDEGKTIHLSGYSRGHYGFLAVQDEGRGVRASDLPHIFDRFYRADNSRSRSGAEGYGLGLSIAKQIIDQHGGEITAESKLNHGSKFVIKLPLADPKK